MDDMTLLVSFPDQSESFVLGWEAGAIWHRLHALQEPVVDVGFEEGIPGHAENLELFQRMAAATSYSLEVGQTQDGWVPVRFTLKQKARPSLKVVGNSRPSRPGASAGGRLTRTQHIAHR